jgi:hypothetical protein
MLSRLTNKSSVFVKYNVAYKVERVLDLVFLAAPLLAVAFLLAALYFFWLGWMGLGLALVLLVIAAALMAHGRYIAPWQLKVRELRLETGDAHIPVSSPRAQIAASKCRCVFFSDLHLARVKGLAWVQRVVDATNAQHPDVVLIGGDFSGVMENKRFADVLAPIKLLQAQHGVFAILGNHDYGIPGEDHVEALLDTLPTLGVRLLRNEVVQLSERVQLLAADELWAKRDDVDKIFQIADANPAPRRVFLGHNPDLLLKMKPNYRADLFIFGHTHHGQIYIPFLPGLAVPVRSKFYRGQFRIPQGMVYVSAGVGEGNSPIRINTRPEIVVFEV